MPHKRDRNNRQKTLWSICIIIAGVIGVQNIFATHLSEFCLSCGGFPTEGVSYDYYGYDGFPLQISQVLSDGKGVLVSNMPGCHINVDTEYTNGGVKTNYY